MVGKKKIEEKTAEEYIEELKARGDVEGLIRALKDSNESVREKAAEALEKIAKRD